MPVLPCHITVVARPPAQACESDFVIARNFSTGVRMTETIRLHGRRGIREEFASGSRGNYQVIGRVR